ncbi:MAG: very short patch repair endonuclease [Candidatus Acidiferrales bacterium]
MDKLARDKRSANMRRILGKNTAPELAVRKIVRRLGFSYRTHSKLLPGKPDIVFTRSKKAIFVHGCFWHLHPVAGCRDARIPKSRVRYWTEKLRGNTERDRRHLSALRTLGWKAIVIWECQVRKNVALVESRIQRFLES